MQALKSKFQQLNPIIRDFLIGIIGWFLFHIIFWGAVGWISTILSNSAGGLALLIVLVPIIVIVNIIVALILFIKNRFEILLGAIVAVLMNALVSFITAGYFSWFFFLFPFWIR